MDHIPRAFFLCQVLPCALVLAIPRCTSPATITPSFFDEPFNPTDWTQGPVLTFANAAGTTQTNQQILTGGVGDDPYWQFTTTGATSGSSSYTVAYFNNSAVYDPSLLGGILNLT